MDWIPSFVFALFFAAAFIAWWRVKPESSRWLRLGFGLGLQALCTIPAVIVQSIEVLSGMTSYSIQTLSWLSMLPINVAVLMGGGSVIGVFEETAKDLSGHRQSTMLDNWPYFLGLLVAQSLLLALLIGWRYRRSGRRWDWAISVIAVLVALNALAGRNWPWWGS